MPRSAFLEGARAAGGTKTCSGAIAKQKTAAPPGAASLSLAVLENDGRKREEPTDKCGQMVAGKATETTRYAARVRICHRWRLGAGDRQMRIAWHSSRPLNALLRLQRIPELCGEQSESRNCGRQIRRQKSQLAFERGAVLDFKGVGTVGLRSGRSPVIVSQ